MMWKRCILKNSNIQKSLKFLVFFIISSLPFLGVTSTVGIDNFLDSFENPESYIYLKNSDVTMDSNIKKSSYLIIQRPQHPEFQIEKSDTIVYSTFSGTIACNKISHIHSIGSIRKYEIKASHFEENSETIYENQILGKVETIIEENIWNSLSLKIWDTTIDNININSLM